MRLVSGIICTSLYAKTCVALLNPLQRINRSRFEPTQTLGSVKSEDTDVAEKVESDSGTNGLPFWWEAVWEMEMMKTGEPGSEIIFGDSARVFK